MKCFNAVAKLQVRLEKREHIILSRAWFDQAVAVHLEKNTPFPILSLAFWLICVDHWYEEEN
jgi:hypothetical protein